MACCESWVAKGCGHRHEGVPTASWRVQWPAVRLIARLVVLGAVFEIGNCECGLIEAEFFRLVVLRTSGGMACADTLQSHEQAAL